MRKLLTILIITLVSGCGHNPIGPKPVFLDTELNYGPEEFREGYNDGCESALAAYGNSMQKTAYSLSKNAKYETNRVYNQVWKDAWNYCYMWLFVQNRKDSMYGKSLL